MIVETNNNSSHASYDDHNHSCLYSYSFEDRRIKNDMIKNIKNDAIKQYKITTKSR